MSSQSVATGRQIICQTLVRLGYRYGGLLAVTLRLQAEQRGVMAAKPHQFIVRTALGDLALLDDYDMIRG